MIGGVVASQVLGADLGVIKTIGKEDADLMITIVVGQTTVAGDEEEIRSKTNAIAHRERGSQILSVAGTVLETEILISTIVHETEIQTAIVHETETLTAIAHETEIQTAIVHETEIQMAIVHETEILTAIGRETEILIAIVHQEIGISIVTVRQDPENLTTIVPEIGTKSLIIRGEEIPIPSVLETEIQTEAITEEIAVSHLAV